MASYNSTYPVGGMLRLTCMVEGDGEIVLTWTKDGDDIPMDTRITKDPRTGKEALTI